MARKGENIYKRKDGRWEGRYIRGRGPDGRAHYGYVYAGTYRDVRAKLLRAAAFEGDGDPGGAGRPALLRDVSEAWLSSARQQVKESSYSKYRTLLEVHLLPGLGDVPLPALTHERIESHCLALLSSGGSSRAGLAPKTVSDALSVLRSVLRFARRLGHEVPWDGSTVRIRSEPHQIRVLSLNEQEALCRYLAAHPTPRNAGVLISLFAGLRVGEVCALHWEDVSLREGTIHVRRTMQRIRDAGDAGPRTRVIVTPPKSPCSVRIIPLPRERTALLAALPGPHSGYFLTGSPVEYVEPRTMQNHFKRVLAESRVADANYHALRHTFATRCVELGFDVKSLSEILGHSGVNLTMNRYVHPSMEHKRESMQRLSGLFAPAPAEPDGGFDGKSHKNPADFARNYHF